MTSVKVAVGGDGNRLQVRLVFKYEIYILVFSVFFHRFSVEVFVSHIFNLK